MKTLDIVSNGPNSNPKPCANRCKNCKNGSGSSHGKSHATPIARQSDSSILVAEEQVLPTLRSDGSRNWLSPSLAKGFYWQRRRILAYGLVAFFVILPHLRFQGKPLVLLDIARRQFTLLGHTFYPTDTPLVACLMLAAFFSIMLVTAVAGRVWCGWGCPQTVYLEFLFRPIDRFFNGTIGRGGMSRKKLSGLAQAMRLVVYVVCCMFLAHTFLSYFVGTDKLAAWMQMSPSKHPVAFLVMGGATLGLLFNFFYFREQFCMIACPYGRFQSVMLDRKSWIVSYDANRGEPRMRGKRQTAVPNEESVTKVGDCIECGRCTAVCPTGIDIRNGLQLECIHCTQCIDACDGIMTKIGKPTGLIRYTSQDQLAGKPQRLIRPRTVIYPLAIGIALSLFLAILATKFAFDARVLRSPGAPFTVAATGTVQNNFRIRLVNRSQKEQAYSVSVPQSDTKASWSTKDPIHLMPGETILAPMEVHFPVQRTAGIGFDDVKIVVKDSSGTERELPIRLAGPR
jgi:cytochrome c oxidase accessory protein FixG